jgi:hypothetical protein
MLSQNATQIAFELYGASRDDVAISREDGVSGPRDLYDREMA